MGGPGADTFHGGTGVDLALHGDALKADAWLVCDGPVHLSGRRQLVFGVRGDANVNVTLYGPKRPLHSGHYGNFAANPAIAATAWVGGGAAGCR